MHFGFLCILLMHQLARIDISGIRKNDTVS